MTTQQHINNRILTFHRIKLQGYPKVEKTKVFNEQFNKSVAALTR